MRSPYRPGTVLAVRWPNDPKLWSAELSPVLLLERKWAVWQSWESTGNWWQWRVFSLMTGATYWQLENALEQSYVRMA